MTLGDSLDIDVLVIGGGGAGLWLLDELVRRGFSALLVENRALATGQTSASQGIIHGGLKYTLSGLLTPSAKAIREMPAVWRACLSGHCEPDLSATRVLSDHCFLWRTTSFSSRMGMIGAKTGLRSTVQMAGVDQRPAVLGGCPGDVYRIDEQVIDTQSLVSTLAGRQRTRLVKVSPMGGLTFDVAAPAQVRGVTLAGDEVRPFATVQARWYVFVAGAGNAALRQLAGLDALAMQRRPLHMTLIRGTLPELFGHCVDGTRTRVTITTSRHTSGQSVWVVGGQVSEDGVAMDGPDLIQHVRAELGQVLPQADLTRTQWATFRMDRAEGRTAGGARPESPTVLMEGNVVTAWPTKLALIPEMANLICRELGQPSVGGIVEAPCTWPKPCPANPPWESQDTWISVD